MQQSKSKRIAPLGAEVEKMSEQKGLRMERDGRQLTLHFEINTEEQCTTMYNEIMRLAHAGKTITIKIDGSQIIRSGE
jgi:hypothetical protein